MSASLATNMLQKHLRVLLQQHQHASFIEQKQALEIAFLLVLDQALGALVKESIESSNRSLQGFSDMLGVLGDRHEAAVLIERSMHDSNHWLSTYSSARQQWLPERTEKQPAFESAKIGVKAAQQQWPLDQWYQGFNRLADELRALNQYD